MEKLATVIVLFGMFAFICQTTAAKVTECEGKQYS